MVGSLWRCPIKKKQNLMIRKNTLCYVVKYWKIVNTVYRNEVLNLACHFPFFTDLPSIRKQRFIRHENYILWYSILLHIQSILLCYVLYLKSHCQYMIRVTHKNNQMVNLYLYIYIPFIKCIRCIDTWINIMHCARKLS